MPRKKQRMIRELQCTGPDRHRFPAEVWCWVHYVEGIDEPTNVAVINTTGVECPVCDYSAEEAK
jgi:hypothetical protein